MIEATNFIEEIIINDLASGKAKEVITRCPPEPTGYWHIGHCKAWCIDFETAKKFGGYTNLRMDDTNPTKEDGDFADSYLADLKWLGYTPKNFIYSSEAYFENIYKIAEKMIINGDAYVCNLSADEVSSTRGTLTEPGKNSPYRNRSVEENLKMFRDMKAGKYEDGSVTLRAKIDMTHPNINMRDPIMYRVLRAHHYRTGDKWCIYPMYDFAHPMEDALEGVTFSLCDINFEDHRPAYNWFMEKGWGKPFAPRQIEFGKLMLENVLLGKRYLKQLVNEKKVTGWDDPRFLTIVGMKRRGYTANGIKDFIKSLGVSKSENLIPFSTLEFYVRNDLNLIAKRVMAVFEPLKVLITNYNKDYEKIQIDSNPSVPDFGTYDSIFAKEIYIEKEDFSLNPPPKYNRLVEGGLVRLKGAYVIKCNKVIFASDGSVDHLECEYLPETKSGQSESNIKVKGTIHFVAKINSFEVKIRNFSNLIKEEYKNPSKSLEEGVKIDDILNPNSISTTTALADNILKKSKIGEQYQFIRKGYYTVDPDSTKEDKIFNYTVSMKDTFNNKNIGNKA
ncbi:MAG: glutamine--tRNA ligase [Clostridia bacterium]